MGEAVGKALEYLDRNFGVRAWLKGEPRPPRGGFDLAGEKFLDWAWICVNLPPGPKRALEVGSGQSPIVPAMLALNYDVVAVDLGDGLERQARGFTFVKGDFNKVSVEPPFDVIVACSAVEHFGLSGRFGSDEDEEGDLKAMRRIRALLHPQGLVFLTIPVGVDAVYKPWHRVYGKHRIAKLFDGFEIVRSRFFIKEPWDSWRQAEREEALEFPASVTRYALAQIVLQIQNASRQL